MNYMQHQYAKRKMAPVLIETNQGIEDILLVGVEHGASDIHLTELNRPVFRIDGDLVRSEIESVDISICNRTSYKRYPSRFSGKDETFHSSFAKERWEVMISFKREKAFDRASTASPSNTRH